LKGDLPDWFEARLLQQRSHLERTYTIDLARSHSAASMFVLLKERMRDAAGPRSDHGCEKDTAWSKHPHHVEKGRSAIRNVIERRDDTHGVERTVAKRQSRGIPDPDVDAVPGKHVSAGAGSMGAYEIVVPAGQIEEPPSHEG
jgi:hypothetical protein